MTENLKNYLNLEMVLDYLCTLEHSKYIEDLEDSILSKMDLAWLDLSDEETAYLDTRDK